VIRQAADTRPGDAPSRRRRPPPVRWHASSRTSPGRQAEAPANSAPCSRAVVRPAATNQSGPPPAPQHRLRAPTVDPPRSGRRAAPATRRGPACAGHAARATRPARGLARPGVPPQPLTEGAAALAGHRAPWRPPLGPTRTPARRPRPTLRAARAPFVPLGRAHHAAAADVHAHDDATDQPPDAGCVSRDCGRTACLWMTNRPPGRYVAMLRTGALRARLAWPDHPSEARRRRTTTVPSTPGPMCAPITAPTSDVCNSPTRGISATSCAATSAARLCAAKWCTARSTG